MMKTFQKGQTTGGNCDIICVIPFSRLPETEAIMKRQTGKTAAQYRRAANKRMLEMFLDNQMHTLLCYAEISALYRSLVKGGGRA